MMELAQKEIEGMILEGGGEVLKTSRMKDD